MKTLPELASDARQRQVDFTATLTGLRQRMTIPALANEGLRFIDPKARLFAPAYAAVKRYPALAAGVVIGAAWLWRRLR